MWLRLFLMYFCHADNLRVVFLAALATFLPVDLAPLTVRRTSPTSSLISSRVPSMRTTETPQSLEVLLIALAIHAFLSSLTILPRITIVPTRFLLAARAEPDSKPLKYKLSLTT